MARACSRTCESGAHGGVERDVSTPSRGTFRDWGVDGERVFSPGLDGRRALCDASHKASSWTSIAPTP